MAGMYNGVEIVCRYFLIQYLKITVVTEIYFVRYRTVVTDYAISDLPKLVNRILCGEIDAPLPVDMQDFLAGFAFETVGASVNWFIKNGEIHDAAILVWVYCLCYHELRDTSGYYSSLYGITQYMLLGPQKSRINDLLLEIFDELFLTSSWELCFDLIVPYIAVGMIAEKQEAILTSLRKKLSYEDQYEDLCSAIASYWSVQDQTLSKYGRKKLDSHIEIAIPKERTRPNEQLDMIKHCYEQIISKIAKFVITEK
jgi:hypothetical protein